MTDPLRSAETKCHITLDVVPPPALIEDGAKGDRYTKQVSPGHVGEAISKLVQEIIEKTSILQQGGRLVVAVSLAERSVRPFPYAMCTRCGCEKCACICVEES